jgi:hypothetical protein
MIKIVKKNLSFEGILFSDEIIGLIGIRRALFCWIRGLWRQRQRAAG